MLAEHDDLVASGRCPHRVTAYFAGSEEGSLRLDMEEHAAGRGMSDRLLCEVRAYQLCKVDDTWAEAVHRDVSAFGKRATAAKAPYIAAAHRMGQTLASVDKMKPAELSQFHKCMRKYKAIGQANATRAKRLRSVHKKLGTLLGQIYRCDSSACRDWTSQLGSAIKLLEDRPAKRRSVGERLQLEYLDSVISDGALLSLPEAQLAIMDQAREAPLADLPIVLQQRPAFADAFFVIVDEAAGRKKQLRTAASEAQRGMAKPVSVQRMTRWPAEIDQDGSGTLLYHDGFPHIVDLMSLAPWQVLRGGLRQWQTAESTVAGCLTLLASEAVSAQSGWQRDGTPTLCLLEDLARAGWARGKPPSEHTLVSSKTFAVKDPMASKAYLRCLLGLESLVCEDKMSCLRSDQPAMYYACVLASEQPQMVPCGQRPAEYRKLLNVAPDEALAALQHGEPSPASPAASSDSIEFCVPLEDDCVAKRAAPGRGRGRGRGRGGVRTKPLEEDWGALVWVAQPPDPQSGAGTPLGQSQSSAGPAGGSGAASSSDPLPPAAESALVAVGPGEQAAGQQEAPRRVILEGVEVHEEAHGVLGQPGSYRRLIIRCPHHGHNKAPCRKTRSFGVRSAIKSGLGDMEPYAFLGCWLRGHARFADVADHKKWGPTSAEVQSYANEHDFVHQPHDAA